MIYTCEYIMSFIWPCCCTFNGQFAQTPQSVTLVSTRIRSCDSAQVSRGHSVHSALSVCGCYLLLFYAIATGFQLYYGADMMYEMRRRNSNLHFYRLKGPLNLVWEELAFYDSCTAKCYNSDWNSYPCAQGHLPHALTMSSISPPHHPSPLLLRYLEMTMKN